ncbi:hypothetical protein [Chitinasiproducens palmae]|uniref:hypothetical protein n=1 Tax=Chitinasiproducens palmae TaxID=1770053 RepID=UPI0011142470|nr:hypothetical protein [Chitinasiproducens palmae]
MTIVQLHDANPTADRKLQSGMEAAGFSRHLNCGDADTCILPDSAYWYSSSRAGDDIETARINELARRAAGPTGKRFSILTVEVARGIAMIWDLDPVSQQK